MFTAKNAQYLTINNDNISPITNIESLYYEKAIRKAENSSNFIFERQSIVKHMPIGMCCNNVIALNVSTYQQIPEISTNFNTVKNNTGGDLILAYVNESAINRTNIILKKEDIYTQKYNLTSILASYSTKENFIDFNIDCSNALSNISIDINQKGNTVKNDADALLEACKVDVSVFVNRDMHELANYQNSSILNYSEIVELKNNSSLNMYKYCMKYPSNISTYMNSSFYDINPLFNIYLQPTSKNTFANQAVAIDNDGNKYDIAFDFNLVGKPNGYLYFNNILYIKTTLEELKQYYTVWLNNQSLKLNSNNIITNVLKNANNLYIKANCSGDLYFNSTMDDYYIGDDIITIEQYNDNYSIIQYYKIIDSVPSYIFENDVRGSVTYLNNNNIIKHTGIYYMKDNKDNEAPYDFIHCKEIGMPINNGIIQGMNNIIKTTGYVKIIGTSNNNYINSNNVQICGNNNKIINSYNIACFNKDNLPEKTINNIILNSYNINLSKNKQCINNIIINCNNSNNSSTLIDASVLNNKLINVNQINVNEIVNNTIYNTSILDAYSLANSEIINSNYIVSDEEYISNNLSNVNIINTKNISRQINVNNTTLLNFNSDDIFFNNPYNDKIYYNGTIYAEDYRSNSNVNINLTEILNYFEDVTDAASITLNNTNNKIQIMYKSSGGSNPKAVYLDEYITRPGFNQGLYIWINDVIINGETYAKFGAGRGLYYIYQNEGTSAFYSYIYTNPDDGRLIYNSNETLETFKSLGDTYRFFNKSIKIIKTRYQYYGKLAFTINDNIEFIENIFKDRIKINFYDEDNYVTKIFNYNYIPNVENRYPYDGNQEEIPYLNGNFVIDLYGEAKQAGNYTMEIIYHKSDNTDIYKYIEIEIVPQIA